MTRRDAERLARLLAADEGDGARVGARADLAADEADADLARLASLASGLESSAARPSPPFRAALRERVVATVANGPPPPAWRARLGGVAGDLVAAWRYSGRSAVASGAMTVLLLLAGLFVGASLSLPGDPLYAIKDAYQQAQLARVSAPTDVASVKLQMAGIKIDDAARAADRGRLDSLVTSATDAEVLLRDGAETLLEVYRDTGDPAVVRPLARFADQHRPAVVELRAQIADAEAGRALGHLLVTIDRVDDRARAVLGGCCPPGSEVGTYWTISAPTEPFSECPCLIEEDDEGDENEEADGDDDALDAPRPREQLRSPREEFRDEFRDGVRETHDGLREGLEETTDGLRDAVEGTLDPENTVDDAGGAVDDAVDDVEGTVEDPVDEDGDEDGDGDEGTVDDTVDDVRDVVDWTLEDGLGAERHGDAGDADDAEDADAGSGDDLRDAGDPADGLSDEEGATEAPAADEGDELP